MSPRRLHFVERTMTMLGRLPAAFLPIAVVGSLLLGSTGCGQRKRESRKEYEAIAKAFAPCLQDYLITDDRETLSERNREERRRWEEEEEKRREKEASLWENERSLRRKEESLRQMEGRLYFAREELLQEKDERIRRATEELLQKSEEELQRRREEFLQEREDFLREKEEFLRASEDSSPPEPTSAIVGKVLVIDVIAESSREPDFARMILWNNGANAKKLKAGAYWADINCDEFLSLPAEMRATSPADVGTIIQLRWVKEVVGMYEGARGVGCQIHCEVTVIDYARRAMTLSGRRISGPMPPSSIPQRKSLFKDVWAEDPRPTAEIVDYILSLPRE